VRIVCTDRTTSLNFGVNICRLHSSVEHKFAICLYPLNSFNASLNNSFCVYKQQSMNSYLRLQVLQSKCFRAIGNHPRRTPTFHLHNSLNMEPIPVLIHRLTDKFFAHCTSHPNPLLQQIRNYTLADLTNVYKNINKTYEAYTALINLAEDAVFFFLVHNFSLSLFAPIFTYI
jgi:hypothetical protein